MVPALLPNTLPTSSVSSQKLQVGWMESAWARMGWLEQGGSWATERVFLGHEFAWEHRLLIIAALGWLWPMYHRSWIVHLYRVWHPNFVVERFSKKHVEYTNPKSKSYRFGLSSKGETIETWILTTNPVSFKTRHSKPSSCVTQYRSLKIIGSRDTQRFQEEGKVSGKAYMWCPFLFLGKRWRE